MRLRSLRNRDQYCVSLLLRILLLIGLLLSCLQSNSVSNNNATAVAATEYAAPAHVSPSAPISPSGRRPASSFELEHTPGRHISTIVLAHPPSVRQSESSERGRRGSLTRTHPPKPRRAEDQQMSALTPSPVSVAMQKSQSSPSPSLSPHSLTRNCFPPSPSSLSPSAPPSPMPPLSACLAGSGSGGADVERPSFLQRPPTTADSAELSPPKRCARFARLRHHEKTKTPEPATAIEQLQQNVRLEKQRQAALDHLSADTLCGVQACDSDSNRPSTPSSLRTVWRSSSGWSLSRSPKCDLNRCDASLKDGKSYGSLRERWRASLGSSSASLSRSSSHSSASFASSSSASTVSSSPSSLDSTPRASVASSVASSRTSFSSDEEDNDLCEEEQPSLSPTKTVQATLCRHFVSLAVSDDEDEQDAESTAHVVRPPPECLYTQKAHGHGYLHPQPLATPELDVNDRCMADPMADAFNVDDHLPPTAEPTPPPTPPPHEHKQPLLLNTWSLPPTNPLPTFSMTPASPTGPFPASPAFSARRSFSAPVPSTPCVPIAEKGTPELCPVCVRLQETIAHTTKVAGIYGPRHSLTVAAARAMRVARVAWAEAQWDVSCSSTAEPCAAEAAPPDSNDRDNDSCTPPPRRTVRFQANQPALWTDVKEEVNDDDDDDDDDVAARLRMREQVIARRMWGPLGERGRKQREFKRSMSESYVPGRWAADANKAWLDTSGCRQTYEQFWKGKNRSGSGSSSSSLIAAGKAVRGLFDWVSGGVAGVGAINE